MLRVGIVLVSLALSACGGDDGQSSGAEMGGADGVTDDGAGGSDMQAPGSGGDPTDPMNEMDPAQGGQTTDTGGGGETADDPMSDDPAPDEPDPAQGGQPSTDMPIDPADLPAVTEATTEQAEQNCATVCQAQVDQGCGLFGLDACVELCSTFVAFAPQDCLNRLNATMECQLAKDACEQEPCEAEFAAQDVVCNSAE